MPEHFNLPWRQLLDSEIAAGRRDAATWRDFPDGTGAMVGALETGEIDLALLLTEGAAAGQARGGTFEILSVYVESPLIWGVHVAPASGYDAIGQLGDARFAISRPGSGSHLMSLALADAQGWTASALELVEVGTLAGAVESFRDGRADVFLWERFMTEPVVARGDFRLVGEFVAPWPAFVVCATRSALHDYRARIDELIDAVGREASRLAESPDAADAIAARYGLEPARVAEWLELTRWAPGRRSPTDAIAAARVMLARAGVLETV